MPGYYETVLSGLQHAVPLARLQETERQNAAMMDYRLRALQGQEALRLENQRRLNEMMEETRRHHTSTENIGLQRLLQQMTTQLQPSFGSTEELLNAKGDLVRAMRDRRSGQYYSTETNEPLKPSELAGLRKATPLQSADRERLRKMAEEYSSYLQLVKGFKPGYAGKILPVVGSIERFASEAIPGVPADMANWWREHQAQLKNPIRQSMTGTSMTNTEQKQYELGDIGYATKPKDVVGVLNRRLALRNRAIAREAQSLMQRHSRQEIQEALGDRLPDSLVDQPSPADLDALTRYGARLSGVGRPPLEELLRE